jgi:ATP-binding protein involved in chromosome partitioning
MSAALRVAGSIGLPTTARRLVARLADAARRAVVAKVCIGLGYTAVELADGRTGVAYTFRDEARGGCSVFNGIRPLAGRPAADLLALLESPDAIEAGVGLACGNALANRDEHAWLDGDILEHLDVGPGDEVGMVGHFGPLVEPLRQRARSLTVFERIAAPTGLLRPREEAAERLPRCQVALITATSINKPHGRRSARRGPSVPAGGARRCLDAARGRGVRVDGGDAALRRRRHHPGGGSTRCFRGRWHAAVQPACPQGHHEGAHCRASHGRVHDMTSENCKTCNDSSCSAQAKRPGEREEDYLDRQVLLSRMCRIKHKIMVLSGKGGVGKSTVSVNLAAALALAGKRVGILDVDIHGPSVPKLLHLEGHQISVRDSAMAPVEVSCGAGSLAVMSLGFLLQKRDDAVIWRGPMKYGAIKQFLKDVDWGDLDYLVVDSPPGTGDEPLAVAQLIEKADGAVVVTTPQEVAVQDVRRSIAFCHELHLHVLGVVENMSGFTCSKCGEIHRIFGANGGRAMAEEMSVPYLGAIPIEPDVVVSGDSGTPMVQQHPHSETAKAFGRIVRTLLEPELRAGSAEPPATANGRPTRIAVPVTAGTLSSHFGHCEHFVLFDVEADGKSIGRKQVIEPPPHEPGTFPKWLHEQGATVIIAGGMGSRAQSLFGQHGIRVIVGASSSAPDALVREFLDGCLSTGTNVCDH